MERIHWNPQEIIKTLNTQDLDPRDYRRLVAKINTLVYKNNAEVFSQWGYITDSGLEVSLPDKQATLDATKVYSEEFSVESVPAKASDTTLTVQRVGSMEAGRILMGKGLNPAILNFADAYHACGMYNVGSNAQEESICRVTTLPPTLYQYMNKLWAAKAGVPLKEKLAYPMDKNFGGIYSKVTVFREGPRSGFRFMEDPYDTAIISVASLSFQNPSSDKNGKPKNHSDIQYCAGHDMSFTEEGKAIMMNKVRTIYRIALENGHDSIVLGAWGCGVFKQKSDKIARLFVSVLQEEEFRNKFSEIFFAVPDAEKYYQFARVVIGPSFGRPFEGPNFFSFRLGEDNIWCCEYPGTPVETIAKARLKDALDFGITHFIDLTEEGELTPYAPLIPDGSGVQHLRFPIKDQSTPKSTEAVHSLMRTMEKILENPSNRIYLHCWGGVGRTGTIASCWLAYTRKTGIEDTLSLLREYWKMCKKSQWREIPENKNQIKFIEKYINSLQ